MKRSVSTSSIIITTVLSITILSVIGLFSINKNTENKIIKLENKKSIQTSIEINESNGENSNSSGTPSAGDSNFGKDIKWSEPITIPNTVPSPSKFTVTNYRRRGINWQNKNPSSALQYQVAQKLDFSSGTPKHLKETEKEKSVSLYYFDYNGDKYYTCAVGNPVAKGANISPAELNGQLIKVNLSDGTTIGGLVVDMKAFKDTSNSGGWGQPYGNEICAFEFYINVDNNTLPINNESSIGSLPETRKTISPIKEGVKVLSFQVSDINIRNLDL